MKEWIRDIAIAVIIAGIILCFIKPTIVKESSMEPTLYENHYIFLSKQSYTLLGEPKREDIIVFNSDLTLENGKHKKLIKRIIGLSGDHVVITAGQVYINDQLLKEDYIKDGITNGEVDLVVPEGEFFCMGDNRLVSVDSRDERVGCISGSRIVGKAVFRLYPFNKIGASSKWVEQSKTHPVAEDTEADSALQVE